MTLLSFLLDHPSGSPRVLVDREVLWLKWESVSTLPLSVGGGQGQLELIPIWDLLVARVLWKDVVSIQGLPTQSHPFPLVVDG